MDAATIGIAHSADVRYIGQGHEVTDSISLHSARARAAGRRLSTHSTIPTHGCSDDVADGLPLEVINWRAVVSGPAPSLDLRGPELGQPTCRSALKGHGRSISRSSPTIATRLCYDRYELGPGATLTGPAIVEEHESTAVLGPSAVGTVDGFANLIVRMAHDS